MRALARSWVSASALCCLIAACNQRASAPGNLPGYIHTFSHSRFDLGTLVTEKDEFGMHKLVGTDGTFATEIISAAAIGTHNNVPFPDPATGVYPGDSDMQNAAVKSYFVTAGLPGDQIASLSADGAVYTNGQDVLEGSYSMLHRGWNGVPIVDSIAYAAFDAKGRAADEQVYWPEIPSDSLAQVQAFQKMLADPTQKAAYLEKLPASSRAANIVIRHTSWFWQGSFQAQACWCGTIPVDPCFDISGHIVQIPGDDGRSADGGTADADTDADAGPEIVCPISDSGVFADLPSGTCTGVGSCAIELDNSCRPGVAFHSSLPPMFDCQCVLNQWQCAVTSGGMGLLPCPDAGSPDRE
jgi:hypothetical protein